MKQARVLIKSGASLVADHEIWPLTFGVALITFTPHWAPIGLGLLVALWLLRWLGHGSPTVRTPLDWPICLLMLMVPVTMFASTDLPLTSIQVSRMVGGIALVYGLANWAQGEARISLLMHGFIGVGVGLALIAPFSIIWSSDSMLSFIPTRVYQRLPTLVSDTINANMMAGALLMLLPFPLAALFLSNGPNTYSSVKCTMPEKITWILDQRWFRMLLYIVSILVILSVLILTKSRGGWAASSVGIFFILVRRWKSLLWLIPVTLVVVAYLAWSGKFLELMPVFFDSTGAITSWETRVEVWSRALYMIQDFSFTGIGAGTFDRVADVLYPFFLVGPETVTPHAHNLLLQVAVDLGIPGLIAFLAILFLAFWSALDALRYFRHVGNTALEAIAWAGLASLVGMLAHGMVDATTWIVGKGAFIPWAVIGMLIALNGLARPERTETV